ncbi:MAG: toprim domain-containing protein [Bacteroidetes bacterium]|nr:toprim domain-containing protein [Bacteroidota bacterium]
MRADQAKTILIDRYLEHLGHKPANIRSSGRELFYHSPIREGDSTPSFKVDTVINKWFDHGISRGGNILDLAIEICKGSVRDALAHLERTNLFSPYGYTYRSYTKSCLNEPRLGTRHSAFEKEKQSLELIQVKPLKHPALLQYLEKRGINLEVARSYLSEIDFKAPQSASSYFGVGFPSGDGYEVRNALFKGYVGVNKKISFFAHLTSSKLLVFEGFMDFLTYLTINGTSEVNCAVVVLNSGNMKARALPYLQDAQFSEIQLYLDNDDMGDVCCNYFMEQISAKKIIDMRATYPKHKDLNDRHTNRTI